MSNYTEAPATILLATNCVCCGRPLVDSCSVELGIGPECRNGTFPEGLTDCDREVANLFVFDAAIAAQAGHAEKVVTIAGHIRDMGFTGLADKVESRFKGGVIKAARNAAITITEDGSTLLVTTPFRRGDKDAFIAAWRTIPGRSYDRKARANRIPAAQKGALWALLQNFFPGKWGTGPKGAFRVPTPPKDVTADVKKQLDLSFGEYR